MKKRLYEAMFLFDAAIGDEGIPEAIRHIVEIVERFDGELVRVEKWDERELAYPIGDADRGIYLLAFFNADTDQVADIRRVMNISERIMRFSLLTAESVPPASGAVYDRDGEIVETEAEEEDSAEEGVQAEEEEMDSEEEGETADVSEESL